jgi:hypothetical protein
MLILHFSIVVFAFLNLAVNAALGLAILFQVPWPVRLFPIRRPDHLRENPDLRTTEKGETSNEQGLG